MFNTEGKKKGGVKEFAFVIIKEQLYFYYQVQNDGIRTMIE